MAQWFHVYDMHDGIVNLVLRTFGSVFPHMEIWDSGSGDLILLGSLKPWASDPTVYRRLFERESPRKDFELVGIKSPEAFWARQLASQQTAFAIAGPGPIQSDLFPVLEYEAPRAFFIGRNAQDLVKFDERTWQQTLAPHEKQQTLATLDAGVLSPVFREYSTINHELRYHLNWRFHNGVGCATEFRPAWPCVFKTNSTTAKLELPADLSEEVKKLLTAAAEIEQGGAGQTAAIETVLNLLRSRSAQSDWSANYYGALAAKASIGAGDFRRASDILSATLPLHPDDAELNFLQRIVSRQQTLLASAKTASR
jgi:hypothetical protein